MTQEDRMPLLPNRAAESYRLRGVPNRAAESYRLRGVPSAHRPDSKSRAGAPLLASMLLVAALSIFVQGCASGPPPTATQLGLSALEAGDWRAAKGHFQTALQADSSDAVAWHGQARAELLGRDPEAALRSLTALSKVDPARFSGEARPTYADALAAATQSRLDRTQTQAALVSVRALARIEPNRNGLPRLLGRTLIREGDRLRLRGDRDGAFALLSEACSVTPGDLDAWVGAAEILLERKDGARAIRLLEAARRSHPTAGVIRSLTLQAMRFR